MSKPLVKTNKKRACAPNWTTKCLRYSCANNSAQKFKKVL